MGASVKYLLDSHIAIWLLTKPHKLNDDVLGLLNQDDVLAYVSHASLWELGLKHKKDKFPFSPASLMEGMQELGVETIAIQYEHIVRTIDANIDHKDPFDMLLCGQAMAEDMVLVTADKELIEKFPNALNAGL